MLVVTCWRSIKVSENTRRIIIAITTAGIQDQKLTIQLNGPSIGNDEGNFGSCKPNDEVLLALSSSIPLPTSFLHARQALSWDDTSKAGEIKKVTARGPRSDVVRSEAIKDN